MVKFHKSCSGYWKQIQALCSELWVVSRFPALISESWLATEEKRKYLMLGSGYERVLKVFMYVCQLQSKDTSNHFTVKVYVDAMSLLLCSL